MRVALYQPDIAGNLGTILRTCACLNVPVDIIEPCGFPFSDRSLKRAGMDYFEQADYSRHADWNAFLAFVESDFARIVLLSSKAEHSYHQFSFKKDDILLFGSESAGVPIDVHQRADARITIPMQKGMRSLNLAVSAGMSVGEALRQTGQFPQ
ncbi:MAG: tRNA (cytidine(34)-2'-O)-methyltransferase [Pseudomonadota bacterium]